MELSVAACATYAAVTPVLLIASYLSTEAVKLLQAQPLFMRLLAMPFVLVIVASIGVSGRGVADGGLNGYAAYFAQSGFATAVGALAGAVITQIVINPEKPYKRRRKPGVDDGEPDRVGGDVEECPDGEAVESDTAKRSDGRPDK